MKHRLFLILCLIFLNVDLNASTYNENIQENNVKIDSFIDQLQRDNPKKNINVAYIKNAVTKGSLKLEWCFLSKEAIKKISDMDWLTSLDLFLNTIEDSLDDIANLIQLTDLILLDVKLKNNSKYEKKLEKLPDFFAVLTQLKNLNLSCNDFQEMPAFIAGLKNLNKLNLSANKLTEFPIGITYLKNLKELNIRVNRINFVPDEICDLTSLTYLNLGQNKLTCLPENIGNLENLNHLNVEYNKIEFIPQSLGNLHQLECLVVVGNNLQELPNVDLAFFKQLKGLYLIRNPFDRLLKLLKKHIESKSGEIIYNFCADSCFFDLLSNYLEARDFIGIEMIDHEDLEKIFQNLDDTLHQLTEKHNRLAEEYNDIEEMHALYATLCAQDMLLIHIPVILKQIGVLINCFKIPDTEMNYDDCVYPQSRELIHNDIELKEYYLPSIGRYFCIKYNDVFPADELFDLMKMLKDLQKKDSLIDYHNDLLREQKKLITKVSIAKRAHSEDFLLLNRKLEATRSLINEIKEDFEAYKSIHEQIVQLIKTGAFYRNERYIQS